MENYTHIRNLNDDFALVQSNKIAPVPEYMIIDIDNDAEYVMHVPTLLLDIVEGLPNNSGDADEQQASDSILIELAIQHVLAGDTMFEAGKKFGADEERRSFQRLLGIDQVGNAVAIAIEKAADHIAKTYGETKAADRMYAETARKI